MTEREFARLIRTGLATPGVKESHNAYGIRKADGCVEANVIGLALIGKFGISFVDYTQTVFAKALNEIGKPDDENSQYLLSLLGISADVSTFLVECHCLGGSAVRIAEDLERGLLAFDDAPREQIVEIDPADLELRDFPLN